MVPSDIGTFGKFAGGCRRGKPSPITARGVVAADTLCTRGALDQPKAHHGRTTPLSWTTDAAARAFPNRRLAVIT